MKSFKIFLSLLIYSTNIFSQPSTRLPYWLYSLPIHKNSATILSKIKSDDRFKDLRPDDPKNSFVIMNTYYGQILQTNLPDSLDKVDSTTIELTFGISNSGRFNIIRIEYFINETRNINALYNLAYNELKEHSKIIYETRSGIEGEAGYGIGNEIIYSQTRRKFEKISLFKKNNAGQPKSFLIEYEITGD